MHGDTQAIFEAARKLPETEQVALVSQLLAHLPAKDDLLSLDDPELLDELDRRFADDEGAVQWSELKSEP